ncbi:hypothetical protein A2973_03775 [Candidatus Gottesmanbacteria bacterium RIFCSPLOWO2_01_FULL_49_10]|uniref:Glycosyltransferase RgtA/B/C/D-like domain-containing protein n=1 Tax=Candidatus Gottesmanbacteria bacterium RIFCSPLOWO2_01_FULL_49_10 TaxID=1798396 RepID=A0A1F6B0Z0_9BACT|nr:MAG: hypothetical protein UY10_C0005G0014 [Microgenomates group bacterium GW2011_GWA2_47_8]OGG30412.1 MAG: hypothetical protein A2973_03775 [Candidatus Gottesmanbacteria bacterium RIFCSPLOWO2_01_FULL_49_10]
MWTPVISLSVILTVLNQLPFFYGVLNKSSDMVYLGTVHYYEDYFFYINHFFQGAHGAWLTVNRYTSEPTNPSIIYWFNILLGKIGGAISLSPILTYNIAVILLSVIALTLTFYLISTILPDSTMALSAFIYATFSTSVLNSVTLGNGQRGWWPVELWKTPHFLFDRLSSVPHQIMQTILFSLAMLFIFTKPSHHHMNRVYTIGSVISVGLLATINPMIAIILVALLWPAHIATIMTNRSRIASGQWIKLISVTTVAIILFLFMNHELSQPAHSFSKYWDSMQQTQSTLPFLILSIGPIVPFAVIGVISKFKTLDALGWFGLLLIVGCYSIFLSPIPKYLGVANVRILFPGMYVFWGVYAAHGSLAIARFVGKYLPVKPQRMIIVCLVVFMVIVSPTAVWETARKISSKDQTMSPLVYLPRDMYDGFVSLSTLLPYDDIVIANHTTHMDLFVPALSGHTSYSGHPLTTIQADRKNQEIMKIFSLVQNPEDTKTWLGQNHIRYIFVTSLDGSIEQFQTYYPFLRVIRKTSGAAILEVP